MQNAINESMIYKQRDQCQQCEQYQFNNYYKINSLLMPKIIQPKRHSKEVSVQAYWEIRNKNKTTHKQTSHVAYREDEVQNRYRYMKPTQQAKHFNPLSYFIKKQNSRTAFNHLDQINQGIQYTHMHQYLSSQHYRVSSSIMFIKKYIHGLQSIIYNAQRILNILLDHLQCEDAWYLIQAMIKDTKNCNFDLWLSKGLQKLAYQQNQRQHVNQKSIYGRIFNDKKFRFLFDTLSVFMQNNYDKIMENMNSFFEAINKFYFRHENKYIRQYSLKSLSYIVKNLTTQKFQSLIQFLVTQNLLFSQIQQVSIGELLLNRHKTIKGCLTSSELSQIVQTLKAIPNILEKTSQKINTSTFDTQLQIQNILKEYLGGIMTMMETKYGHNNNDQIIFDLNYFLKALQGLCQNGTLKKITFLLGLHNFLSQSNSKKFLTHNNAHQQYMNQTFRSMISTIRSALKQQTIQYQQIYEILGKIFQITQETKTIFTDKGVIQFCKMSSLFNAKLLMSQLLIIDFQQFIHKTQLAEFVLLIFSKYITQYFKISSTSELAQFIYSLTYLIKKLQFKKLLSLQHLGLNLSDICEKIKNINSPQETIIFIKTLKLINLTSQKCKQYQTISFQMLNLHERVMTPFSNCLSQHLHFNNQQSKSIFDYNKHLKSLLRYSHQQVQWVGLAFNIYSVFEQGAKHVDTYFNNKLYQKIAKKQHQKNETLWRQVLINRINQIQQSLPMTQYLNNYLHILNSRRREVRHKILNNVINSINNNLSQLQKTILQRLCSIDRQDIDLQNERQIKKDFTFLQKEINQLKKQNNQSKTIQIIGNWCIGFAFVGFKLIQQSFISFLTVFLQNYTQRASDIIISFLQYYTYRHSRKFQFDTKQNSNFILTTPKQLKTILQNPMNTPQINALMKIDFEIQRQYTIQWIGIERITQAIKQTKKFKNQNQLTSKRLVVVVQQYFQEEFVRKNNIIKQTAQQNNTQIDQTLLLQPKTRYLSVILRIVPDTFLPPFQCLHFVKSQYFSLKKVQQIKRNNWQALWQKKSKGSKTKDQIIQTINTTFSYENMSVQQQFMYIHYLWGELLSSNQHRRRIILQHLRDRVIIQLPYIMKVLYKQLHLEEINFSLQANAKRIEVTLKLQNKKILLNLLYIIKAIIVIFKKFLDDSDQIQKIVNLLKCFIKVAYQKQSNEPIEEQQIQDHQIQEGNEEQDIDEEKIQVEQAQKTKKKVSNFTLMKQHRKQIQKVLTELFNHHHLNDEQTFKLLKQLAEFYKIQKIGQSSVNSVPGILVVLRSISQKDQYRNRLIKFGIIQICSQVINIDEQKIQSNQQSINICLQILTNIFHLSQQDQNKMLDEEEEKKVHHISHSNLEIFYQQSQQLLDSIYQYIQNSRETGQIDYTHQGIQNAKSMHNNNTVQGKQPEKHRNSGTKAKNIDFLWTIISKIVNCDRNTKDQPFNKKQLSFSLKMDKKWEGVLWDQISKIAKIKILKDRNYIKLHKLIEITLIYIKQNRDSLTTDPTQNKKKESFIRKIFSVLPSIPELSERIKITSLIHKLIKDFPQLGLGDICLDIVDKCNSVTKNGLVIQIDYEKFFEANNSYANSQNKFNILEHEYIIYNLLPYITSEQLSIRKAIKISLNHFLQEINKKETQISLDNKKESLNVFSRVFRIIIEQLKKNNVDSIFWSIVGCIGLCIRFVLKSPLACHFENQKLYLMFSFIVKNNQNTFQSQNDEDFFHLIGSLSQGNKMKALKLLKQEIMKTKQDQKNVQALKQSEEGASLPHPITLILQLLQHIVLPTVHSTHQNQYNVEGNLSSTLTHISLQIYQEIIGLCKQSTIKKQLKRLSTKIKFDEQHSKKNILIIKIISQIVEGIDQLPKCTGKIKSYITDFGFNQFHEKLIANTKKSLYQEQENQEDSDFQDPDRRKKIAAFGDNLEQLQSQEAINRNFMNFDKKMLAMEEQIGQTQQHINTTLIKFLRMHILIPLKSMLFYENRSSKQAKQEQDRSRMLLSVAITKLLIKFPMETFLFQFQKILSKLARLLKKRSLQVRQNGRKCLCQIAKIVGPEMLYAIILELKFHLRDNFQQHIFNYTVYQMIQGLGILNKGDLDYCLPLILPMVVDQIFGKSSEQKKMVDENQVPTLNMQSKKKKGNELLILLSKQLSVQKIQYLIGYLQKFLKEYLTTEVNLAKYEAMINHLTNGLGNNEDFISPDNALIFGKMLCNSMMELRKEIKIYQFDQQKNKISHQSTIKTNNFQVKKVGKQCLQLQEEAGRNKSIFKKMSKQVVQKRNRQILINSMVQFYLAIASLLLKKQVLSLKTVQKSKELTQNFIKIMTFTFQCMDHRDNRIVSKCMRILHQALIWNTSVTQNKELQESSKSLRKKVSRKILLFIQKLTASDQNLLKESFTILIDLFSQITITKQLLPTLLAIIKLHSNNTQTHQSNVAQPLRLFKTILYKLPQSIYEPIVYQMYQMIRLNVVACSVKDIRQISKSIALTYVKPKQHLMTALSLQHPKQQESHQTSNKKNQQKSKQEFNVQAQYQKRIKNQLNFYISNLDCHQNENQLLVLQILNQLINNRSKSQIQQIWELVLLSLVTSLVNHNEHIEQINQIIKTILATIDKNKIINLMQKCVVWINQSEQKKMIRQCGYHLIERVLAHQLLNYQNQNIRQKYILQQPKEESFSIIKGISMLLSEELEKLQDYLITQKQNRQRKNLQRNNKEWYQVLDQIDVQDSNPYVSKNNSLELSLIILQQLLKQKQIEQQCKTKKVILKIWKLLYIPSNSIVEKCIKVLLKVNSLGAYLQNNQNLKERQQIQEKQQEENNQVQIKISFNLKGTLFTLANNQIQVQSINSLIQKLQSEPMGEQILKISFYVICSLLNKLVVKFKLVEPLKDSMYYLLNNNILKIKNKDLILKNQALRDKLLDCLGKISRNQFVSAQVKELNEQAMDIIKEEMGVAQFYKKLGQIQSQRRQKKQDKKVKLAQMAITDQKAFTDIKSRKKVKQQ